MALQQRGQLQREEGVLDDTPKEIKAFRKSLLKPGDDDYREIPRNLFFKDINGVKINEVRPVPSSSSCFGNLNAEIVGNNPNLLMPNTSHQIMISHIRKNFCINQMRRFSEQLDTIILEKEQNIWQRYE